MTYQVHVQDGTGQQVMPTSTFETLPDQLPPAGVRPFTVMLGSCFWSKAPEAKNVAPSYEAIWSLPFLRPHLNFLVGDQVYLDAPWTDWGGTASPDARWIKERIADRYDESWTLLAPVLRHGVTVCITDDHEYWNDYPNGPTIHLTSLARSASRRKTFRNIAQLYVDEWQRARLATTFNIGNPPQLSFFIADTRQGRTTVDKGALMPSAEWQELLSWITNLQCPGVLVTNGPLFVPAKGSYLGFISADRNLPGYPTAHRDLALALQAAPHDILVLAGDVHFGRISSVCLEPQVEGVLPVNLFEVIASPMAQLPGAEATFWPEDDQDGYPRTWPANLLDWDPTPTPRPNPFSGPCPKKARLGSFGQNQHAANRH